MKRFWSCVSALLLIASPAFGLTQSQSPPKFPVVWGASAGSAYIRSIPVPSQIGIQNCAASFTDGEPPLTFTPATAGGCPPFGQDFNGIFKQITQGVQWQQAGGPIFYDSAFATTIGGYPNGARIASAVTPGTVWISTADNNTTNPDSLSGNQVVGGSNWVQDPGQVPIGTPIPTFAAAPSGYVLANSVTIGNASSNATGRAGADTQSLFALLWVSCPNTVCPIFTSLGGSTTRGANAAADYAANKALATPEMQGAGLIGIDSGGTTFLTGVPVTQGNATTAASILGENLHSLTAAENGPHTHGITDPGHAHSDTVPSTNNQAVASPGHAFLDTVGSGTTGSSTTGITINSSGSGTGHNTVERSFTVRWMLKL